MPRNPVAAAILVLTACSALAQDAESGPAPRQTVSFVPRVSVTETVTNNVHLVPSGQQSDAVTEITPGIRINIEGSRLKTYFDYAVSEVLYEKSPASRRLLNSLNTYGVLEAVDNWAFLDFSGSIAQQAISAFGTPSTDNAVINANQTEVSTYRVSPYVRGLLGDLANYEARVSRSVTNSATAGAGSSVNISDAIAKVGTNHGQVGLDWSVDASHQAVDYSAGRATAAERLNLTLPYAITPQFKVSIDGGRESNNYTSVNAKSYGTGGFGVTWSPSELSKLTASRDHRSFGDAHNVSLESRTSRTVWKFSDIKDVTATPGQTTSAGTGSIYDLLFSQFASVQPDPIARAQLVNAYLQANGMSPTASVSSGFLTSTMALQRRQDLSFALLGVRDTVTFIAMRSLTSNLDALSLGSGDLANGTVVHQRGFSANYAHRLTPDASLNVLASQQVNTGSTNVQDARLRSLNVNLTRKAGANSVLTLGLRHVISNGALPYVETAVIGNLNVPF